MSIPAKPPTATIATTDSAYAAALMARGARLLAWKRDGATVEWTVCDVAGDWIDDYKSGRDGFRKYSRNRIMLAEMAKTLLA